MASTTEKTHHTPFAGRERLMERLMGVNVNANATSGWDWFTRVRLYKFNLPKPEEIAMIRKNVEAAEEIGELYQGVLDYLQHLVLHVMGAKANTAVLKEIIKKCGGVV
ncbi:hypothetical protein ACLMJK_007852 [Lecanora helva]